MELLIQELRLQRDALLRRFEALDTRAGIVLGFAGAVATFSPAVGPLGIAGRSMAVLAATLSLASFIPRDFPMFKASVLLGALVDDGSSAERRHVDLLARSIERARTELRSKSRALALAVTCMVAATMILGAAIILPGGAT